ncbi:XRE family transcriptional regulator [Wohlfahrtiimonas chitiniclastica]|uniref:XRE family transcriptional regulator n=1 Tax=Wohlfahrtiimonas chitiniclastica TaxID=400946 RepID=UPI001BCEF5F6|nr:helix-turn-helix transcriptional regulator [Wohlfahrtiimonas chitiniclastica]MBS7819031.1 helix-turn-helix transcriptional regulator [Wohlfahrtiimonas chitiniclastica]
MMLGDRLREEREKLQLSQEAFGALGGVGKQAQLRYEKGERYPDGLYFEKIASVGCDIQYIITGIRTENISSVVHDNAGHLVDLEEFCFVPRYKVFAAAGHGSAINEETYEFSLAYRKYWVKKYLEVNPKDLIAITARGDSMIGVINDKDVMLIDTANKLFNDGIYVLRIDGDLIVKSVQKLPNKIIEISSTNPLYKPFTIDMKNPPNDFDIIGCVVHVEPVTLFRNRCVKD